MAVRVTRTGIAPVRGIGSPDYAAPKPVGQVPVGPTYTSTDIAELAARLGSFNTFDRRGNVVWMDDFESGINKWYATTSPPLGAPHRVTQSAVTARNGAFSAELYTYSGLISPSACNIKHSQPYPVLGNMGLEFSFAIQDDTLGYLYAHFTLYIGTTRLSPALRYDHQNKKFQYLDAALNWIDLATGVYLKNETEMALHYGYTFNTVKLVVDFPNRNYLRAILNDKEYSMDNIPVFQSGIVFEAPYLDTVISIVSMDAVQEPKVYIDDVIITQNEPGGD